MALFGTHASIMGIEEYNFKNSVTYHTGQFPPVQLKYELMFPSIIAAASSIAKYDALLSTLPNSEILLAPLRAREAVISSRIEGTVATLDEVLEYEADAPESESVYRQEVLEVVSYRRAMNHAQRLMVEGLPLSGRLLREAHSRLLFLGRGSDKNPGNFKTEQNYIVDRARKEVLFVPVNMADFDQAFAIFENYMNDESIVPLLSVSLCHAEFEALHPFKDGNGRLGRMLITLMLWNRGIIRAPHFYISSSFEKNREEYIDKLREVSALGNWTDWCIFFFSTIISQAEDSCKSIERIRNLYDKMKGTFREISSSQWSINALDFMFGKPIFRNSEFTENSGIPRQTAHRITTALADAGLLSIVKPASGRRSTIYGFYPLINEIASD
jgi:Fic family protein